MAANDRVAWIRAVVKDLEDGDELLVEGSTKDRRLTVTEPPHYVEMEPYRCNGIRMALKGYGTTYTMEIPETRDGPVLLLYTSAPGQGEIVKNVETPGRDGPTIITDTTASDLGIPDR